MARALPDDPVTDASATGRTREVLSKAVRDYALVGTPETVGDRVDRLHEVGVDTVVGYPARGIEEFLVDEAVSEIGRLSGLTVEFDDLFLSYDFDDRSFGFGLRGLGMALLGLILTYRLARRFASVFAAALATVTVWLASPLLFYTYIAMPWSHATAFFLFALFLTLWLYGWERPLVERMARRPLRQWLLLGLVGGLMTITREQLGLLLIIPAVEGVVAYVRLAGRRHWGALGQLLAHHGAFLVALLIGLLPQFAAYQVLNGRPGPSSTVGNKLDFTSPNFFNTLLDPAHGAFLWSPVLVIGLAGLFWLARQDRLLAALLGLGFLAQTYINGSFGTTWHLSGAFGFRRLIECTPIFVLGLAVLLDWLRLRVGYGPLVALALLLVYWNVGLIAQWAFVRVDAGFRKGLIWEDMFYYQFVEVPRQVLAKAYYLFADRCRFVQNC